MLNDCKRRKFCYSNKIREIIVIYRAVACWISCTFWLMALLPLDGTSYIPYHHRIEIMITDPKSLAFGIFKHIPTYVNLFSSALSHGPWAVDAEEKLVNNFFLFFLSFHLNLDFLHCSMLLRKWFSCIMCVFPKVKYHS